MPGLWRKMYLPVLGKYLWPNTAIISKNTQKLSYLFPAVIVIQPSKELKSHKSESLTCQHVFLTLSEIASWSHDILYLSQRNLTMKSLFILCQSINTSIGVGIVCVNSFFLPTQVGKSLRLTEKFPISKPLTSLYD